jgi:hypothetical protein
MVVCCTAGRDWRLEQCSELYFWEVLKTWNRVISCTSGKY